MNERRQARAIHPAVSLSSVALVLLLASCGAARRGEKSGLPASDGSPQETAVTPHPEVLLPSGRAISVEIAADDETREQGLMFRESVPPGKGMLFIFPASGEYPFWMKNTVIPLDMIWIDSSDAIVHIERNVQPCVADPCPSYPPNATALYVLEMAAGEADRNGLRVGDHVTMRNLGHIVAR